MTKETIRAYLAALTSAICLAPIASLPAQAESVLHVGMTAGDIPDWTGQPDQGFEGFRFVGWTLHDSFINWDLSRSDVEAPLRGGLATKMVHRPHRQQALDARK
jgi:peptide/nickel transport system substrate-binding protein